MQTMVSKALRCDLQKVHVSCRSCALFSQLPASQLRVQPISGCGGEAFLDAAYASIPLKSVKCIQNRGRTRHSGSCSQGTLSCNMHSTWGTI